MVNGEMHNENGWDILRRGRMGSTTGIFHTTQVTIAHDKYYKPHSVWPKCGSIHIVKSRSQRDLVHSDPSAVDLVRYKHAASAIQMANLLKQRIIFW